MTEHVKYLPDAAIPQGGAPAWDIADAERWLKACTPALFAPVAGGWVLAPLVLAAAVLLGWNAPEAALLGTTWRGYPEAVLLVTLPLWFRFLPAAVLVSAPVLGLFTVLSLHELDASDSAGRAGVWLVAALSAWAFTGALLRLRSRRRQRELALAAAGKARSPLPEKLPEGHRRRGRWLILAGDGLCLAAAALLLWGLVQDLRAHHTPDPYDATGQQVFAMLLLIPGTPLLGRGITARLAARRLHTGPQPVLRVGLRADALCHIWLYPDARTVTGRPLIAYRDRFEDTEDRVRVLVGGEEARLRSEHHDINQFGEPFEAILYGVPCEGAELVLEYAAYDSGSLIASSVTAVPLLAVRRNSLGRWSPAGTSYTVQEREKAAARRADASSGGSGCGSSSSCSSCSSCGGGCGGGD
ncbi:hypothetical protein NLX86_07535 [Streptomyces sp. A3M-1-3]|uniref:hypothetical protein n=1 Tax=Streptomyces sp. A3M-1-3 TaxID=2962044 RepID=UPI0020B6A093|nr:hypothetical protein [Streptomyces sp. A3M-1-3]MCP3817984.1 hypothetical protein [Streptomyces sp. A3M-1-3]